MRSAAENFSGIQYMSLKGGTLLFCLCAVAALVTLSWYVLIAEIFVMLIIIPETRMKTVVTEEGIKISYGLLPVFKCSVPKSEIISAEAVTYRPLRDFGGWGLRSGRLNGEKAFAVSIKSCHGVLIRRKNTRSLLIGTPAPERLLQALNLSGLPAGSQTVSLPESEGEPLHPKLPAT